MRKPLQLLARAAALWLLAIAPAYTQQTAAPPAPASTPKPASGPAPSSKWEGEIAAFEAHDRESAPPKGGIVFVGSSSIRLWKTLASDFPDLPVINRGFGGSVLADTVYFTDRIVLPYEPRQVVVYAGGNDLHSGVSPEKVAADFKEFVEKVHQRLPKTQIDYIASSPNPARTADIEKVKTLNSLIAKYCEETKAAAFIDTASKMLGEDGKPRPELYGPDRLHMSPAGYHLWVETIRPYLTKSKAE